MDIKKLFNRNKAPNKIGKNTQDDRVPTSYVNRIYLSFPDIDGEPTFELEEVLSIGSEVGDAIINDDDVSPRHCTFTLNQDVISLMDHNSQSGTFINKKKIDPGRIFILQDKDKIRLGTLPLIIEKIEEPVYEDSEIFEGDIVENGTVEESISSLDSTSELEISALEDLDEDSLDDDIPDLPMPDADDLLDEDLEPEPEEPEPEPEPEPEEETKDVKTLKASGGLSLKKVAGKTMVFKGFVPASSNSLVRVIAILIEVLIIILSFSLIGGNDAFFNLLKVYPNQLVSFVQPYYTQFLEIHIQKLITLVPALPKIWLEIISFFEKYPDLYYGMILFLVIRIVTPIIFGVSVGQALIGVSGRGHFLVKRIMGMIREFIGVVTFPLLIFDLPSLLSKRTFKEVITFTHIESVSKIKTIVLSLLLFLVLGTSYFVSPMVIDLDIKSSIPVNDLNIKMKKVELASLKENSKSLNLEFVKNEDSIVLPVFKVVQSKKKRQLIPSFNIVNLKTKTKINIAKIKSFSLGKLLSLGVESNYLASMKFPKIVGIVNDVANTNKNFKQSSFKDMALISEIENLVKTSFSLSFMNLHEHALEYGPFLKGFVDLRFNIESIVNEQISMVSSTQLGDSPFIILQTGKASTFFEINNQQVSLYRANTNRIKDLEIVSKDLRWGGTKELETSDGKVTLISFVDELLSENDKNIQFYQKSYELLYSTSRKFIITDDKILTTELKTSVASILKVIDYVPGKDKDKFVQNITDLLKAINDNDKKFFGVSDTKSAKIFKRIGR